MKLATVTSSLPELEELVPLLRDLYFEGSIELLCLVNSEQEAALNAIPAIHRARSWSEPESVPLVRLLGVYEPAEDDTVAWQCRR